MNPKNSINTGIVARSFNGAFEIVKRDENSADNGEMWVKGHATTFSKYLLAKTSAGEFYERIEKSAFDTADMSDVIMLFDHNGLPIARTSNGTLKLEITDKGFYMEADLSKSDRAKEIYQNIQVGLITKMSWGFMPLEIKYDGNTRIYTKIGKVYDVSAVGQPANNDTEIELRNFDGFPDFKATPADKCRELRNSALIALAKAKLWGNGYGQGN
jgi:HK97 family phage prohead protease